MYVLKNWALPYTRDETFSPRDDNLIVCVHDCSLKCWPTAETFMLHLWLSCFIGSVSSDLRSVRFLLHSRVPGIRLSERQAGFLWDLCITGVMEQGSNVRLFSWHHLKQSLVTDRNPEEKLRKALLSVWGENNANKLILLIWCWQGATVNSLQITASICVT